MEIEFKRPELEDRDLINKYFMCQSSRSCEMTFSNIYLWSRHYKVTFAVIGDMLLFKSDLEGTSFVFPIGSGDLKKTVDFLMDYCREQGIQFQMHLVSPENFEKLQLLYPDMFEVEYDRGSADYVYESEKLITLAGKKYHGKRNHINKFKEMNPDWTYEAIGKDNVEECFQMGLDWRHENECDIDAEKTAEMCVTLNSLRLLDELNLKGGLIRAGGKVIAFSIGEPVSRDTFVVHIEKAYAEIQGAYPMINQQFVEHAARDYSYINREEDTGAEGLRKAKLSYRPVFMVEKGQVRLKAKSL